MSRASVIRNAADRKENRFYSRLEKRQQERFDNALLAVLDTPQGRTVLAHLVRRAGVFTSPFNTHGGVQSHNIGRQDVGRELMADITRISLKHWQQLEREEMAQAEALEREIEAQHTRAVTGDDNNGE